MLGIIVSSLAGISKDRDLAPESKSSDAAEFNLFKGLAVAVFAGVLSACMSFALTAGKPIAHLAKQSLASHGGSDLWQNLPVLIVVLLGGFCTNFVWCVYLNLKNRSSLEYVGFQNREIAEIAAVEAVMTGAPRCRHGRGDNPERRSRAAVEQLPSLRCRRRDVVHAIFLLQHGPD